MKMPLTLIIAIVLLSLSSCSYNRCISQRAKDTVAYCPPAEMFDFTKKEDRVSKETLFHDTLLLKMYTAKDLLLANAAGVYHLLHKLDSLKKQNNANRVEILEVRADITIRLLRFSTQVQSVVAELDCESERAEQMAVFLEEFDTKAVRRLTISSIVVGAITGILTSISNNHGTQTTVGVTGGAISATLGLLALRPNKKIYFYHKRNLLTDVWEEKEYSTDYPSSIWYIFNEKKFSNQGEFSICHNTRERWVNFGYVTDSKKEKELYFGKGGRYSIHELETRADMLNQLIAAVRQIHQNIEIFVSRFAKE